MQQGSLSDQLQGPKKPLSLKKEAGCKPVHKTLTHLLPTCFSKSHVLGFLQRLLQDTRLHDFLSADHEKCFQTKHSSIELYIFI